ncbi:hypothetical protein ACFL3C_02880 [Patescibacteria group bacterium]
MQKKIILKIVNLIVLVVLMSSVAYAATSVPEKFIYEGRLLDSTGTTALTTAHTFRFSLWSATAVAAGDVTAGVINVAAPNYGSWEEEHTTTPNSDGFFSLELGSVVSLPTIDSTTHLYLQVEVKESGDPVSSYEILDRAPSDALVDRAPIGSVPYALNADTLDNADVGTTTGDVVVLGPSDAWPVSTIPGGTNEDDFVLDSDDDAATSIGLQFGTTLSKVLSWDIGSAYFNFNDDVNIDGDLTISGTVDGVDVATLDTTVTSHLDGGASKHDASEVDVEASDGHYYFAGDLESAIDDIDEQLFSLSSSTTTQKIILPSIYEGVSYKADGSSNIGRLYFDHDGTNDRNYYAWTSTRSSLQDYDVIVQVPLPNDFDSWNGASPWTFNYRSSNAASTENKADIYIYDTAGALVTLTGSSTNLVSTTWATTSLGNSGTPTFTAGETFLIVIRMHAKSNEEMNIGEIVLDYAQT